MPTDTNRPYPVPTLLDLVMELAAAGATDGEVVAAVEDLLETGRVRLIGHLFDADSSASDRTIPLARALETHGLQPIEEACLT